MEVSVTTPTSRLSASLLDWNAPLVTRMIGISIEMNPNGKVVEMRKVYQIKITLKDIKPPIWRRLQVTNDTVLEKLHAIIQVAMGWSNSHLHQFTVGHTYYSEPDPDYEDDEMENENGVAISQLVIRESPVKN